MWLLLVAAGTGYLARRWQKSHNCKTGPCIIKCNATIRSSQGSPSYTPRWGRSAILGRHGPCKRSRSTRGVGNKFLHGRKEGKLVTTHVRGSDDNLGSPDIVFDESLCGEGFPRQCSFDHGTLGQVQNSSLLCCMHGKQHEPMKETYSCMEKPLLYTEETATKEQSNFLLCDHVIQVEKPKMDSSNDGSSTRLEGASSSSRNRHNYTNPTESVSLDASIRQLVNDVPAPPEFLRGETNGEERRHGFPFKLKKLTEQSFHFFSKVARGFGRHACSELLKGTTKSCNLKLGFSLNTQDVHVFRYLSYGKPCNKILSEEKKRIQRFGPYFVHSQHLKALLDPEFFGHCQRCIYMPFSSSSYDLNKETAYSADFDGLGGSGDWVHPFKTASEFSKPTNSFVTSKLEPLCSRENHIHSFNEVSYVALGLAMGVLLATSDRKNELEDLHKLLRKNNALIQELKTHLDLKHAPDPSKLLEVEKVPSGMTPTNITCLRKVHLHPEISSCPHEAESNTLQLFNASNSPEANEFWGFDDLEAELAAELQLIELNGCNNKHPEHESKWTQHIQHNWQPEGDENEYVDKPDGDETSYLDIDVYDPTTIQDAGQVYDSDFVVPPLELERRLWQVLEQRHEERICELENDLCVMQEKVTAKEMEVQWWKDRVHWLMETSHRGKCEDLHPVSLNF